MRHIALTRRAAVLALAPVLLIPALATAQDGPARIEPVTIETAKGRFTFQAEIADTPDLRERGLMFRHRMAADRGMLFNWGSVGDVAMWMKNTHIPLDMIFIGKSGRVVNVAENTVPFSETIVRSSGPVAGVLEVVAGTAARIGLKPGDRVLHPMFESDS